MTQIFDKSGTIIPVTILKAETCRISQIKNTTTDGYTAIQLAYNEQKLENLNKSIQGHLSSMPNFKEAIDSIVISSDKNAEIVNSDRISSRPALMGFKSFGEFLISEPADFQIGQTIGLDQFFVGQKIQVRGKSIGKGFAGNQKRHNFSRGPMTHGSKNHRLPGSIGAGSTPGRVYPGKKMAGQLGGGMVKLKNVEIITINSDNRILILKGSVPGKQGSFLKIEAQT
jgi:large subunit ribosomal protein L3